MDADTEQILNSESDKPSCVISTESSSVPHTDAATRSGAGQDLRCELTHTIQSSDLTDLTFFHHRILTPRDYIVYCVRKYARA
uniref:Uncharacterized protein n=1 Tax=uncultured haloarchaeon TaxID=160804 RepID=A0A0K1YBL3_9EURY|nr:hypothetical protein [uncultured haloarchaeon]